jgi:hypothetical protein
MSRDLSGINSLRIEPFAASMSSSLLDFLPPLVTSVDFLGPVATYLRSDFAPVDAFCGSEFGALGPTRSSPKTLTLTLDG